VRHRFALCEIPTKSPVLASRPADRSGEGGVQRLELAVHRDLVVLAAAHQQCARALNRFRLRWAPIAVGASHDSTVRQPIACAARHGHSASRRQVAGALARSADGSPRTHRCCQIGVSGKPRSGRSISDLLFEDVDAHVSSVEPDLQAGGGGCASIQSRRGTPRTSPQMPRTEPHRPRTEPHLPRTEPHRPRTAQPPVHSS
jgi:hypothetical protein